MRLAALLVLAWVMSATLGACASLTAPAGPAEAQPQIAGNVYMTPDGLSLPLRQWLPDDAPGAMPRAVVIALHGFNDYSKAFDKVPGAVGAGPFLAARGIAVYAYDQRGFGQAPYHGLWAGSDALTADFDTFVGLVRARYPGVPVYGLGESMGGAVVMAALGSASPPRLDGVILVSPAVWARETMPAVYRVALWLGARLFPGWRPTGQSLGRQASDNIEMLRDNGRDPYFIKKTRIDAVYGLVNLMDAAFAAAERIKLPALYLYGRNDQIIPSGASAEAMAQMLAADPRARGAFYDQGWHMMLRDKNGPTVLADIAAFIAAPDAPLPSRADQDALGRLEVAAKKKKK